MATTTDKGEGEGLGCPKFSGKDDEYQVWITKFEAYAKVKGFDKIVAGTEVPPPASQAVKSADEMKSQERNDHGCCTMLLAMDSTGKAFTMVALAKTAALPAGCLKKAYNDIKKTYAPNSSMQAVLLKKEVSNCKPKSEKADPDVRFNELEMLKMRLAVMGSTITDDDMLAHILNNVSKSYEGVVTNTMMRMHQTPVSVFDMKGAIKDRFQYMKDHGILKKDPEEAFFSKKFKGNVASKVTRVPTAGARKARKEAERTHREPISVRASSVRRWDI